jgi:signal transduction histidine kinase
MPDAMDASFSVAGESRDLHPIVRDEIYRIGYEAIRNAFAHSGATKLAVDLRYNQDVVVHVRDNGKGIDPTVAENGKKGHFGLRGMRERANRIGGKFTMVSSRESGTEITLVVPGSIVFRKTHSTERTEPHS